jgi:NitT/TauT family transport system ATP-binding protein
VTSSSDGAVPEIVLRSVGMAYPSAGQPELVLANVDLQIDKGEFFVLVGPSGSGKSTLLKLIAGTALPNEGQVFAGGQSMQVVTGPDRSRGMVFQAMDGPLFDWLNVIDNIAFGQRMAGKKGASLKTHAQAYIDLVGLKGHEAKYPHELSGGMKQRVQIARTLAAEPDVVLMDEPFAALDALTRRVLQREIARIWRETGKTFIYVTHDIREAVLLGQRIAVLSAGPRAAIRHQYDIPLPYPRDDLDPRFAGLVRQLEGNIETEANRQWTGD